MNMALTGQESTGRDTEGHAGRWRNTKELRLLLTRYRDILFARIRISFVMLWGFYEMASLKSKAILKKKKPVARGETQPSTSCELPLEAGGSTRKPSRHGQGS